MSAPDAPAQGRYARPMRIAPLARSTPLAALVLLALCLSASAAAVATADVDGWAPFADADVIEIVTTDDDGDPRETKIWIVVLDGSGFVRTNDSRWLANIRRGSPVALRVDEWESSVTAEESADRATYDRVERAFKEKYGAMQRFMSFFRMSEPTVLRLTLANGGAPTTPAVD